MSVYLKNEGSTVTAFSYMLILVELYFFQTCFWIRRLKKKFWFPNSIYFSVKKLHLLRLPHRPCHYHRHHRQKHHFHRLHLHLHPRPSLGYRYLLLNLSWNRRRRHQNHRSCCQLLRHDSSWNHPTRFRWTHRRNPNVNKTRARDFVIK